ncbi:MAG: TIGR00282 family metallophosphoesterase [Clostridia bacterium]|nr:TIGR00282 family metallophosphoesterase [Clostridia bacterium]MBQ7037918.1 TIGR00282 family metallophosphoesterase [Clostridia bacterium]
MNILCVGDVVGSAGCAHLEKVLPTVRRNYAVDVCIINGENSADGNGITRVSAERLFACGADAITTGNHVFRRPEAYDLLDEKNGVLRPANYPASAPGGGVFIVDKGRYRVAVINLLGLVYMDPLACPFEALDALLADPELPICRIVDFHAEATAEKKALGFYADGRVTAVLGTHTHVQTADEQILDGGTAFISDIGMTGPIRSVLGIRPELAVSKMKGKLPVRFAVADGACTMNAVLLTVDHKTGKTTEITRLDIR